MAIDVDATDGQLSPSDLDDQRVEDPRLSPRVGAQMSGVGSAEPPLAATDPEMPTGEGKPGDRQAPALRAAVVSALMIVVMLAGLIGWLGFRVYQSHESGHRRALFIQVARQGAVNLTTIDFAHADADVQRILQSATGTFYDDFSKRSKPFVEVVKQAQSRSEGTVTEAGLESEQADSAQVLVAVAVKTSIGGAQQQEPRLWRMRIAVQKVDNGAKVSNIEFVP